VLATKAGSRGSAQSCNCRSESQQKVNFRDIIELFENPAQKYTAAHHAPVLRPSTCAQTTGQNISHGPVPEPNPRHPKTETQNQNQNQNQRLIYGSSEAAAQAGV
jgi:hypothetical protein